MDRAQERVPETHRPRPVCPAKVAVLSLADVNGLLGACVERLAIREAIRAFKLLRKVRRRTVLRAP